MKKIENLSVGIAGLGLMGGAIARALKGKIKAVFACDIDEKALAMAKEEGFIDEGFLDPSSLFPRCDLIFLCLNPSVLLSFMEKWAAFFAHGTLLTDIAGVKTPVVRVVERVLRDDLDFIPGHPMAGSEKGGYAQSKFCDFTNKNYILTPLPRNKPENVALIKEIIAKMGFGRITETTAADHDRKIAFTSQLCHIIAASLIDCEPDASITRFGGGSFEDLTRIALLNAPQWAELFLENKAELLSRISQFEKSLGKLKRLIETEEKTELENCLQAVRERRAALK